MARIIKKCDKDMFGLILSGKKKFEVRLGNFRGRAGDTLVLNECEKNDGRETGRKVEKKIGLILRTKDMPWWSEEEKTKKNGFAIIGFGD